MPKKAELLLMAANCALAAGRPQVALDWAQAAHRLFRSQQSAWWQAQAALVLVQARYAAGQASAALLREANRAAVRLEAARGRRGGAGASAGRAGGTGPGPPRRRRPSFRRGGTAAGGAVRRCLAPVAGSVRRCGPRRQATARLFAACRRGLEVLDEHRFTLGASELRAQATAHGAELAALAQRHAARARRPRLLLAWSERWRATALAVPAVRPPADAELNAGLAALRDVMQRPGEGRSSKRMPTATLEQEQQRLEGVVRACALRARGIAAPAAAVVSVAELLDTARPRPAGRDRRHRRHPARAGVRRGTGPAVHRRAAPEMPPGPPASPASPCAAWPAADPATTWAARWPS